MRNWRAEAGPDPEVVLEATYGWYWTADLLQAYGARVHVAHPALGQDVRLPAGRGPTPATPPTSPSCCACSTPRGLAGAAQEVRDPRELVGYGQAHGAAQRPRRPQSTRPSKQGVRLPMSDLCTRTLMMTCPKGSVYRLQRDRGASRLRRATTHLEGGLIFGNERTRGVRGDSS
jgi:hypothetical protein